MLSIQIDRAPQGGHFSAMNGMFLHQGLQLILITHRRTAFYALLCAICRPMAISSIPLMNN